MNTRLHRWGLYANEFTHPKMSSINMPARWGGVRGNIGSYKHIVPLGQLEIHVDLNVNIRFSDCL